MKRRVVLAGALAGGALALGSRSWGADTLRLAKSVPFSWTFTPAEVGVEVGIFAQQGIGLEISGFGGDARLQQAMTAGSVDIGLGSGPALAFIAKGVPAKGVAALANEPRNIALIVLAGSPVRSPDDLRGKKIGVTTVGSLTDWLAQQMAIQKGWGQNGVTTVPVGGFDTSRAVLKTGQVDALVISLESGYALEDAGEWRVVQTMDAYAPKFITHVIFASNTMIERKPDQVARFLKGWFETIAWMKTHKERTVDITARVLQLPPKAISRAYDEEMGMFSTDGAFNPQALEVLKKSFLDMRILDAIPRDDQMLTRQFIPVLA
jgi:NitT/TauT family transport system substrate-binding protein